MGAAPRGSAIPPEPGDPHDTETRPAAAHVPGARGRAPRRAGQPHRAGRARRPAAEHVVLEPPMPVHVRSGGAEPPREVHRMRNLDEIGRKKAEVTSQVVELGLELAEQDPPLDDARWREMCLLLGMVDGLSWALG